MANLVQAYERISRFEGSCGSTSGSELSLTRDIYVTVEQVCAQQVERLRSSLCLCVRSFSNSRYFYGDPDFKRHIIH